jgi:hypothetical protein
MASPYLWGYASKGSEENGVVVEGAGLVVQPGIAEQAHVHALLLQRHGGHVLTRQPIIDVEQEGG